MAFIVPIYIDEAIALGHLRRTGRDDVPGTPVGIAEHLAPILDSLIHSLQMTLEIVDAVVVVDGAVRIDLVIGAHTVFGNEQGLVEQVGDLVADIAQAQRIDLPAKVGAVQIGVGVGNEAAGITAGLLALLIGIAAVVAEGDEIHRVGSHDLKILRLGLKVNVIFSPGAFNVAGITPVDLHIHEEIFAAAAPIGPKHVHGVASGRVQRAGVDHTAVFAARVNGAQQGNGFRRGYKHIVSSLVHGLGLIFSFCDADAAGYKVEVQHIIHLIEGQPVFDPVMVALKHSLAVVEVKINGLAVAPAAVMIYQIQRGLVVGQGDDGLDAEALHFVKKLVIEAQALLIGFGLVTVGKDAAPGDGQPEAVHPHFGHQLDIILVMMIAVHGDPVRIVFSGQLYIIVRSADPVGSHVRDAQSPAFSAFALVGSHRASPEKSFWKCFLFSHGSVSFYLRCAFGLVGLVVLLAEEGIISQERYNDDSDLEHRTLPAAQDEAADEGRRSPRHFNGGKRPDKANVAGEVSHEGCCNGNQKDGDNHAEIQHDGEAEQHRFIDVEQGGHQRQTAQAAVLLGLGTEAHGQHQANGAAGTRHGDEVGARLVGDHVRAVGSGKGDAGVQQGLIGQTIGTEDGVCDGVDHRAMDAEHPEQAEQRREDEQTRQGAETALQRDLQDANQNLCQGSMAHKAQDGTGHKCSQNGQETGNQSAKGIRHALRYAVGHFDAPTFGQHRGIDPAGEQGHDDGSSHAAAAGPCLGDNAAHRDISAGDRGRDQCQEVDQGDQAAGEGFYPFKLGVLIADTGRRGHSDDVKGIAGNLGEGVLPVRSQQARHDSIPVADRERRNQQEDGTQHGQRQGGDHAVFQCVDGRCGSKAADPFFELGTNGLKGVHVHTSKKFFLKPARFCLG